MGCALNHIEISRSCLQASVTQGIFLTYWQKMGSAKNSISDSRPYLQAPTTQGIFLNILAENGLCLKSNWG